jgi:rRNA maturation endonuclease Nob1
MRRNGALFCVSAVFCLLAGACAPRPAFKPVGSVKQLMQAAIDPSSEVLFEAVGTVVSSSGVEEIAPQTEEEWAEVRNSALVLAESGNLLMMGERARDRGEWMKLSQALVDVGVTALKAAEAKNPEALFEAGGQVYEVCQQCHSRYWQPAQQKQ